MGGLVAARRTRLRANRDLDQSGFHAAIHWRPSRYRPRVHRDCASERKKEMERRRKTRNLESADRAESRRRRGAASPYDAKASSTHGVIDPGFHDAGRTHTRPILRIGNDNRRVAQARAERDRDRARSQIRERSGVPRFRHEGANEFPLGAGLRRLFPVLAERVDARCERAIMRAIAIVAVAVYGGLVAYLCYAALQ